MKWVTPVLVVFVVLVVLCSASWFLFGANVMMLFATNPMITGDTHVPRRDAGAVYDAGDS